MTHVYVTNPLGDIVQLKDRDGTDVPVDPHRGGG